MQAHLLLLVAAAPFCQAFTCDDNSELDYNFACDGCNGQFWINSDCTDGFYCTTELDDPFTYNGCHIRCQDDEIIKADIPNKSWSCVKRADADFQCPGKFHLECPDHDVGSNFTSDICECPGQTWVSHDCRETFWCNDRLIGGGMSKTCDDGNIVEVTSLDPFSWTCTTNVDRCPGLGGFHVGCQGGNPVVPPLIIQCPDENYGKHENCDCNNKLYIEEDCKKGFFCNNDIPQEQLDMKYNGCVLECDEGKVLRPNFQRNTWQCVDEADASYQCPGDLEIDCHNHAGSFEIRCNCKDELWVSPNCRSAFYCEGPVAEDGSNPGNALTCPPGKIVEVDFSNMSWNCSDNVNQCPNAGGFHLGCSADEASTTSTTTQATESSTSGVERLLSNFSIAVLTLWGLISL